MNKKIDNVVLFLIDQTSKVAKQYAQREFDKTGLGITVDQWVLLKIIDENNGLSQTDLAEKSWRDPASITRTLDLLQKKSFLTREPIPGNRRQYHILLTPAGQAFVNQNMEMVENLRSLSTKGFSEEELSLLQSMLLRIQQNMS